MNCPRNPDCPPSAQCLIESRPPLHCAISRTRKDARSTAEQTIDPNRFIDRKNLAEISPSIHGCGGLTHLAREAHSPWEGPSRRGTNFGARRTTTSRVTTTHAAFFFFFLGGGGGGEIGNHPSTKQTLLQFPSLGLFPATRSHFITNGRLAECTIFTSVHSANVPRRRFGTDTILLSLILIALGASLGLVLLRGHNHAAQAPTPLDPQEPRLCRNSISSRRPHLLSRRTPRIKKTWRTLTTDTLL